MGNWASRLGCLGERSRFKTGPKAQESPSPCADLQGLCPPGVSWAWWGTHAIQVTEVTETVVTETVVTEAVEVGAGQQGRQPAQRPPVLLNALQCWLDGMEELQASQGPLAADAMVAAAQLREQELLQCLLQERAPQVEPSLREMGSPARLRAQWRRLVHRAETRWGLLQQLVPAAQRFDAARETLLERLGLGERFLAELGQGQLGPKGQERVVQCLQHVCEDATAYTKDLGWALETGQRLAELLMDDEAQLVRQQLKELQECVKLTMSGAAQVWQTLLCAQRIGSTEHLPSAGLEAQLDLEGVASEGPGLKDEEQLSIQLAQLAEWLEPLAPQAEVPGQAAAPMVPIWEQCLSPSNPEPSGVWPAVLQAELEALRGHWSETQEPCGLKAAWELAQWSPCDLAEETAIGKGLKPEGGWAPLHQEFPGGQQSLVVSWPWRGPAWRGGINFEGTCHLRLLMKPPGSQPIMSCPPGERPHAVEGTQLLIGHIMEELLTCLQESSQAETLRTKVGPMVRSFHLHSDFVEQPTVNIMHCSQVLWAPSTRPLGAPAIHRGCWAAQAEALIQAAVCEEVIRVGQQGPPGSHPGIVHPSPFLHTPPITEQSWRLEVPPGVLSADGLKPWTAAPVQVLAHRDPNQADTPRVSQEELSWLLWEEGAIKSWSHRKLETREGSWRDKDHLEQDLTDRVFSSGQQERVGLGCLGTSWGSAPTSQLTTMLESELPNSQQPPSRGMARAEDTDGDKHTGCQRWVHGPGNLGEQVVRGALMVRVGGGWVALDEFLVKNDPGRAKGRTSCKIHERFQCWAGVQSQSAQDIIPLRLWTSISNVSTRRLSRKHTETPALPRLRPLRGPRSRIPEDTRTQQALDRKQCMESSSGGSAGPKERGLDEERLGTAK